MPPKKTKKSISETTIFDALEKEIHGVTNWIKVVDIIRRTLKIPDLSTRNALRKCYTNIGLLSSLLNAAFDRPSSSVRLKGGIMGIWGKLSSDIVLRNALAQAGIVSRIASMLESEEAYIIALQTLATMTRHGGSEVRFEIAATATPGILKVMREHPLDTGAIGAAVPLLAHTVASIYQQEVSIYLDYPAINLKEVIDTVSASLSKVSLDHNLFVHGHEIILSAVQHVHSILENNQPALDIIIAGLRVSNLNSRAYVLSGLRTFHARRGVQVHQDTNRQSQPRDIRKLPDNLKEVLFNYGLEKSSIILEMKALRAFEEAQIAAARTRDFVALGLELGELILMVEHSLGDGWLEDADSGEKVEMGLPYNTFMGSLPVAASALRERNPVKYADIADMLDIKALAYQHGTPHVRSICEAAMKRSKHAFWYYFRAIGDEDREVSLRWAKLGLQCEVTTPYLRFGLLEESVKCAIDIALKAIEGGATEEGSLTWNTAVALLHCALEDATTFVNEASPDCRAMQYMCAAALLVTLLLKGNQISPTMDELKDLQHKLKIAEEFSPYVQKRATQTAWQKTYETIAKRYEKVANHWDPRLTIVNHYDGKFGPTLGNQYEGPRDDLAEWLATTVLEDGRIIREGDCNHSGPKIVGVSSYVDGQSIAMYQCSYCRNASASLKKCSRCGSVRYCDTTW